MQKNVSFSPSIKFIRFYSFNLYFSLSEINILSSVTSICDRAFEDCSSLTEILILESITEFDKKFFLINSYSYKSQYFDIVTSIKKKCF